MTRRELLSAAASLALAPKCTTLQAQGARFAGAAKLADVLAELPARAADVPIGELVVLIGKQFLGTPYVGKTLDEDATREFCVVTLEGLDCVTFFETSLAIARAIKLAGSTAVKSHDVIGQVTKTRYRGGQLDGYLSRLHYTCDWMADNVAKGTVGAVVDRLECRSGLGRKIDFMSTHSDKYAQLAANPGLLPRLGELEAAISGRPNYYVPREALGNAEKEFRTGDIVGIVTSTEGLDCSHTGLLVREGDTARFMHASSKEMKVIFDGRISEYVGRSAKSLGVMVVRPREP